MSADGADEWMENAAALRSTRPAALAFGSRHPIDDGDAAYDEDLYVVRCRSPVSSAANMTGAPKDYHPGAALDFPTRRLLARRFDGAPDPGCSHGSLASGGAHETASKLDP
jgi:hypothetical protein